MEKLREQFKEEQKAKEDALSKVPKTRKEKDDSQLTVAQLRRKETNQYQID
jgi:hypothetical protein